MRLGVFQGLVVLAAVIGGSSACSSTDDGETMSTGGSGGANTAGMAGNGAGTANAGMANAGMANGGSAGSPAGGAGGGGDDGCDLALLGAPSKLVISEVVPGEGIEVYNPTATAIAVNTLSGCSNFSYLPFTGKDGVTMVPPKGRAVLAWPAGYTGTDSGGEILLQGSAVAITEIFGPPPDSNNMLDYVCWGNHSGGRETDEIVQESLYSGACAPAITGGSLQLKPGTDGMSAASYDVASPATLMGCP